MSNVHGQEELNYHYDTLEGYNNVRLSMFPESNNPIFLLLSGQNLV